MVQPKAPAHDVICNPIVEAEGYYSDIETIINPSRKDHFLLVLDVPCVMKDVIEHDERLCHGGNLERLEYSVWGAVIPDVSITKLDIPFDGQSWAWSGLARPAYSTINCNFTVDNRYDNYYILWKWLNLQHDVRTGARTGNIKDYSTTITIFPMDENKKPVAEFTFFDSFITSIGGITKSTRDPVETETTFSFDFSQLDMRLI